jgi:hypothetical protein
MNRIGTLAALLIAGAFWVACGGTDPASPCGDDWSPVEYPNRNGDRVSIPQGVWGDVWFWEGNFMPVCPTGSVAGVGREMRIHELTSRNDVEMEGVGPFYSEIRTPLVSTVWSDADGFFQVSLPAGRYSVFSVEDTLFYANRFDGNGHIFPVQVVGDSVTGVRFDITYRAAY